MKRPWIPIAIIGAVSLTLIGVGIYFRKELKKLAADTLDYVFTDNITYNLKQLNPAVQKKFAQFIDKIQSLGWKVQINSAYRTFAQQALDYAANNQNAKPGLSMHNYGLALDLQISKDGVTLGKSDAPAKWLATGIPQYAKSIGLVWGGDAFGNYTDDVHFQVGGYTGSQLQQLAFTQFGTTDPNKIIGNQLKLVA